MGYEAMMIRFEGFQRQRSAFDAVQGLEWVWRGSDNGSPKDQDIFTHCMYELGEPTLIQAPHPDIRLNKRRGRLCSCKERSWMIRCTR